MSAAELDAGHDVEASVYSRYASAASERQEELCCPIAYDADYLKVIPQELIERDYGCGDPTPFVRPGDTVVDLGSGGGKACYIIAQIVGPEGSVIGVDCNQEMLALARRYRDTIAQRLGYSNVDFRCGLIQDLALDLDRLADELQNKPIADQDSWLALRAVEDRLRREQPLIPSESVDCVVSNCVLNLVKPQDRQQLFGEIFRVLRRGGRVAVSDIVADEGVPESLRRDAKLWSGCISGAYLEDQFLQAFEDAGFHGIQIANRQEKPWQTVAGIEFRSMTVVAYKGKQGPCVERNQALVYCGPFKAVQDDDGHTYSRGERTAVCDKTFHLLQREPYAGMFEPIEPLQEVPLALAQTFDCSRTQRRDPRESKGSNCDVTTESDSAGCPPGECC